jgi:hypothetical protein
MPRALSDKDTARLKRQILENTTAIVRLKARIKETLRDRGKSLAKRLEWEQACAEFHQRYAGLAFPGGYNGALERISSGDPEAMEAAICFSNAAHTFIGRATCSNPFFLVADARRFPQIRQRD